MKATALPLVLLLIAGVTPAMAHASAERRAEVSETSRLSDRRTLASGERAYVMGDAAGLYPATGWHIRGEMGGFWSQPVKLLDGAWFALDGQWLGIGVATTKYTRGWGHQRFDYAPHNGIRTQRTEFVPRGSRATKACGQLASRSTARRCTTNSFARLVVRRSGWPEQAGWRSA